jgi:hypothetical protein
MKAKRLQAKIREGEIFEKENERFDLVEEGKRY